MVRTIVVGLIVDPGLPTSIAKRLLARLPEVFTNEVSNRITWDVRLLSRALPLDEEGNVEVWQHSDQVMQDNGWDLLVCLTELTRRIGSRFFISDLNIQRGVALISLPALGPLRLHHQVRKALVRVVRALTEENLTADREATRPHRWSRRRGRSSLGGGRMQHEVAETDNGDDSYLALSGLGGTVRLLAGMVRINQPWRLVPKLDRAIAAAVATAGFGIFYSSIWSMADAVSPARLSLISIFVVMAMSGWLMFHNGLWERERDTAGDRSAMMYNTSTAVTVAIGVLCMYLLLVAVALLGALAIIPSSYLATTLNHDVTLADYAGLAWFVSSMGTLAGALGSSLEGDEAIQRATYARREHERHTVVRGEPEA